MKRILKLVLIGVMVICPSVVYAETIDISSNKVKMAMESFDKIFITGSELYNSDGYNIDSISNNDLVGSAIKLVDDKYFVSACETDKKREAVTINYLNEKLSNYFINKTIDINNIKRIDNEVSYSIAQYEIPNVKYGGAVGIIIEGDSIKLVSTCGAVFSANPYIERKIVKAEEDDDNLYIYEKQAFAKYSDKEEGDKHFVDYYKDYQRKEKVESNIESAQFSDIKPDFDLYNTYKYTFKKQDNNYYFYRLENLKDAKEYKSNTTTVKKTSTKETNPKTSDTNLFVLLGIGISMVFIIVFSSRKVLKK